MRNRNDSYIADKTTDVLVVEALGKTRYRTPDNFLYCEGVRIASTKPLLYRADEMRNVTAQHGMVLMQRPPEVLFSQDTLASFQGKSITNSHPPTLVDPKCWKKHTVGIVLNPRQGTGDDADYMVADLLITDEQSIRDVENGKCEVSCGYDQDHTEIRPGLGRFTRITGNHVALVEKGRCGPQCAIGDEEDDMTKKASIIERLRSAFRSKDQLAFDTELEAAEAAMDGEQRVVIELPGAAPEAANPVKDEDPIAKLTASFDEFKSSINTRLDAMDAKMKGKEEEEKEKCEDMSTAAMPVSGNIEERRSPTAGKSGGFGGSESTQRASRWNTQPPYSGSPTRS